MKWEQVREAYPNQWLIIEAVVAHSEGGYRIIDHVAVVEVCADSETAFRRYQDLHRQFPHREFYFIHTDREQLDIHERLWLGLRVTNAAR